MQMTVGLCSSRVRLSAILMSLVGCVDAGSLDVQEQGAGERAGSLADAREPMQQSVPAAANPDPIRLSEVTTVGNACATGAVNLFDSENGAHFFFTDMKITSAAGVPSSAARTATCTLRAKVQGAPRKQFALRRVTAIGAAVLLPGSSGSYSLSYGFAGSEAAPTPNTLTFQGSKIGSWVYNVGASQKWSRCGETPVLVISNQLVLQSAGDAVIEVSDLVVEFDQKSC
jgi:Domain of unknown function (DUF4360)